MNSCNFVFFVISIELIFTIFIIRKIVVYKKRKTSFLYEPIILFLLGSTAIYLLIPLMMLTFNWSWHNLDYSMASYLQANLMVFGYMMVVLLIYYILYFFASSNSNLSGYIKSKKIVFRPLTKKQNYILIFFFLIPIMIITLYLVNYMFRFGMADYLSNRIILRKGMGFYVLISYMGTLVVPILFANLLLIIKQKIIIIKVTSLLTFFIVAVAPFLTAFVLMGNRLPAFILIIILVLVYFVVMEKRITFKFAGKFFVGLIIIFLFFTFAGFLRLIRGEISAINLDLLLSVFSIEIEHAFIFNFGNFEHLVWLIEHKNSWNQLYGETFFSGFINLIPRSLLDNKLLGGGPNLKNIINPGSYNLTGKNITSYTTGIAIETYMNFKFIGLFIIPFFHALVLIFLKSISEHIRGNVLLLSVYLYLLFSVTFLIMFGEFLGIYTQSLIITLPFIIFYLLSKKSNQNRIILS